ILRAAAGAPLAASVWPAAALAQGRSNARRERTAPMPLSRDETATIEQALGKKGNTVADQGVFTIPLPRNDLKVTIQGEPVPIPFGFGGWVSFKKTRDGRATVLMSDTVFMQDEINGVISAAQANGIEITAIHNHFFFEEPRIFY